MNFKALFDKIKPKANLKNKDNEFVLFGNGDLYKTEEEMRRINKVEADAAYKECMNGMMKPFFKDNGFIPYKTNAFVRLNGNDIIEYISFQKQRYGEKTFTVNIALIPSYVPHDFMSLSFGDRIGIFINGKDFWWDYQNKDIAQKSFENVKSALSLFIFPWFEKMSDKKNYFHSFMYEYPFKSFRKIELMTYFYLREGDIESAQNALRDYEKRLTGDNNELKMFNEMTDLCSQITDCAAYIEKVKSDNIEKLKLPKKLFYH